MLTQAHEDTILAGRADILAYLQKVGIRTVGGHAPKWRTVQRWRTTQDFPLCPGIHGRRTFVAALSSVLAVTAWMLSRTKNGHVFRVDTPQWQAWRQTRALQKHHRSARTNSEAA